MATSPNLIGAEAPTTEPFTVAQNELRYRNQPITTVIILQIYIVRAGWTTGFERPAGKERHLQSAGSRSASWPLVDDPGPLAGCSMSAGAQSCTQTLAHTLKLTPTSYMHQYEWASCLLSLGKFPALALEICPLLPAHAAHTEADTPTRLHTHRDRQTDSHTHIHLLTPAHTRAHSHTNNMHTLAHPCTHSHTLALPAPALKLPLASSPCCSHCGTHACTLTQTDDSHTHTRLHTLAHTPACTHTCIHTHTHAHTQSHPH